MLAGDLLTEVHNTDLHGATADGALLDEIGRWRHHSKFPYETCQKKRHSRAVSGSDFLVRVTKVDAGVYVSAVDPRGMPASTAAATQLIASLKAALGG
jgi:hypothetical protein